MNNKTRLLICILYLACSGAITAQSSKIDSLKDVVRKSAVDTAVIDAQVELASIYRKKNVTDTAQLYADQAQAGAQRIHYVQGEARAFYQKGVLLAGQGMYVDAMRSFDNAAVLADSAGDKRTQASALQGIGNQKSFLGDYTGALEYCLKSIEIKRQLGDSAALGTAYTSLGVTYATAGQHEKALQAHFNALRIDKAAGNAYNAGTAYYNIASNYSKLKRDSLAMMYADLAIALADSLNNRELKGYPLGLKGQIYMRRRQFAEARELHEQSLAIATEFSDERLTISECAFLGEICMEMNDWTGSEQYHFKARDLSIQYGLQQSLVESYYSLGKMYERKGDYKKAAENFQLHIQASDRLSRDAQKDEMTRLEMNYNFEKERELAKAEQDKNNAIYEEDKKRKSLIIYAVAGFLILVLGFLGFVYSRYRISQKQKALIQEQKLEVEHQSALLEEKNKDITDSINYASRIQSAILPDLEEFRKFLPDSFVYFRPKDIVSGDFYWEAETEDYIFYATVDCTGHGVPGGFMSMLGMSMLNEIVIERKLREPSQVMDRMREKIISALKQKGHTGENKDGMDMVLCRVNRAGTELCFAAAHNDVWLLRDGAMQEFKADKQPVGIGPTETVAFRQHTVALQKGDIIYTFTDGFADQFGGQKNKKYKYRQLKNFFLSISKDSMQEQGEKLNREFVTWKGITEQVDDVLVIGVRV